MELDEREARLLAEPEFNRADRIYQLALTRYVYPGATHTRLLHTYTVLEFGTQMLRRMEAAAGPKFGTKAEWDRRVQLFRLCALYHDLGHGPFSHAGEEALFPYVEVSGQLVQQQKTHEDYSVEIITTSPHGELINRLFASDGITADDVARVLRKGDPIAPDLQMVRELIDSDMDADKFAYLLDDSYFCGVDYGRYDHRRLIQTARVWGDSTRGFHYGIDDGGVQVAESVVVARYWMNLQVYYHRTRRAYDYILTQFLRRLLPGGAYPADLRSFLAWDDVEVFTAARDAIRTRPGTELAAWGERLHGRKPLSMVWETPAGAHIAPEDRYMFVALRDEVMAEIERRGLHAWHDTVGPRRAHRQQPVMPETEAIMVLGRDGRPKGKLIEQSKIMEALLNPIQQVRIYADCPTVEVREELREFADQRLADMRENLATSGLAPSS